LGKVEFGQIHSLVMPLALLGGAGEFGGWR